MRVTDVFVTADALKDGEKITVSVTLKNVGNFDAKEVAQLYIQTPVAQMMRPLRELKGYEKVFIKQGKKETVKFEIGLEELGYYNPRGEYVLDKGIRRIFVGENCLTENKIEIEIS